MRSRGSKRGSSAQPVSRGGWKILDAIEYEALKDPDEHGCYYAVQAGPLIAKGAVLVRRQGKLVSADTKAKIFRRDPREDRYERSAVGIGPKGELVLVSTSEAYLHDLAQLLDKLGIERGLALGANRTASLCLKRTDSQDTEGERWDCTSRSNAQATTQASVIAVFGP